MSHATSQSGIFQTIIHKLKILMTISVSFVKHNFRVAFRPLYRFFWFKTHFYSSEFFIPETLNRNLNYDYTQKALEPEFQSKLEIFKEKTLELSNKPIGNSFYKFGDGDYFFLKGLHEGSAKPGNRALSRELNSEELRTFQELSKLATYYMCEVTTVNRRLFHEVFPEKKVDFPAEVVYGLTANKWFTKNFAGKVGLIGADTKIELIQCLMNHDEYQEYLGLEKFEEYFSIPQKYACDNPEDHFRRLEKEILASQCRFYLLGIGHLKSSLIGRLANTTGATLIDIGSGIDALAGVIDSERPYFAEWINYRTRHEFDYNRIDYLQYKKSKVKLL